MVDTRLMASKEEIGRVAAELGGDAIRRAIAEAGSATIVVATGLSQFETLSRLTADRTIDWGRVTAFHLDEYVGLPETHKASFRRYLRERFVEPLGGAVTFHPVSGEGDPAAEAARLGELIGGRRIDVCFAGIGENGHLAFNDPLGEGWFPSLEDVPRWAISMSIRQIMRTRLLVLSAPDLRKAAAVRDALEGPVTPAHPASIIQTHPAAILLLDRDSASLLGRPA